LKLACAQCHKGAASADRAGFPETAQCRVCHPDKEVTIPSRRVYQIADYVFFSHARHTAAKVDCQSCHGPVSSRESLTIEVAHTMKSCIACHKARGATLVCNSCHELGQ